jgi:DNA-binding CsgD family transcriptional regulator/tetratricopeptide (TPR) repeat protein
VASLIDKSLMRQIEHEGTEPRFLMHMSVREYGLECLRESGEEDLIRRAHADYYLALVEEAEPHLKDPQQLLWLRRLDREQENLRAALNWLITHEEGEKALRFCVALWWFWQTRGYWSEGRRWLKTTLALPSAGEKTSVRARALSAAGELAAVQGDLQEACLLLTEGVTLCRELGDDLGLALPLATLGDVLFRQGDITAGVLLLEESITLCRKFLCTWELSRALLKLGRELWLQGELKQSIALTQESLVLARKLRDMDQIAHALNNLGHLLWNQGELVQARAHAEEGLMLLREMGDKALLLSTLETLGSINLSQGGLEQARGLFTEGLSLAKELGNEILIAWHLIGLARVAAEEQQFKRAVRLFAAAEVRYDANRDMSPDQRDDHKRTIGSLRASLGEQAFVATWAEGRDMTQEQILSVSDELKNSEPGTQASYSPNVDQPSTRLIDTNDLTPRELEVLRLVAQGLSDIQIAEKLVISRRTVNAHLTSIYRKIKVSSRSAATRYAIDRKLI